MIPAARPTRAFEWATRAARGQCAACSARRLHAGSSTRRSPARTLPNDADDALSDSIKSLMRQSAQSVGIITTYLPRSDSSSSEALSPADERQRSTASTQLVHGATLSSFTTVSMDPPLVAFSLRTPSRLADALEKARERSQADGVQPTPHLIINVLARGQEKLAAEFAKPGLRAWDGKGTQSGDGVEHPLQSVASHPSQSAQGVPVLSESLGALSCSIVARIELGVDGVRVQGRGGQEPDTLASAADDGIGRPSQLFIARVHAIEVQPPPEDAETSRMPLVYWRQSFTTVNDDR